MSRTVRPRFFAKHTSSTPSALVSRRLSCDAKAPSKLACRGAHPKSRCCRRTSGDGPRDITRIPFRNGAVEDEAGAAGCEEYLMAVICRCVDPSQGHRHGPRRGRRVCRRPARIPLPRSAGWSGRSLRDAGKERAECRAQHARARGRGQALEMCERARRIGRRRLGDCSSSR